MKITITNFFNFIRSQIYRLHVTLAAVLMFSSITVSCVSLNSHLRYSHRIDSSPPTDAFAFIMVTKTATPQECHDSPEKESCELLIEALPPLITESSGSGMLIKAGRTPIVLTAGHVCSNPYPNIYDHNGIKFSVETSVSVRVRTNTGEVLPATVLKIEDNADLCALQVEKMFSQPVRIASKPLSKGAHVFAISAPLGINSPTMTLMFQGFYAGYDSDGMHYYTIATRPGSSGSIVLDENYRAVGMLNAAFTSIEHIGLGAGLADLELFISDL